MSAAKHTPWRVVAGKASYLVYAEKPEGRSYPLRIATVNTALSNQAEVAHLLATAPEMLALLEEARSGAFDSSPIAFSNWLSRAEAAIAKATGSTT